MASLPPEDSFNQILQNLATFLQKAGKSAPSIIIPQPLDASIDGIIRSANHHSYLLPEHGFNAVVKAIESEGRSICYKLSSRAFILLFALVRLGEPCLAIERILYLLKESLGQEDAAISTTQSVTDGGITPLQRKKGKIGQVILAWSFSSFCNTEIKTSIRRLMGALSFELIRDNNSGLDILAQRVKHLKGVLGRSIMIDEDITVKLVAGLMIRELTTKSEKMSLKSCWPKSTDPITYQNFPRNGHEQIVADWISSFIEYVKDVTVQGHSIKKLFCPVMAVHFIGSHEEKTVSFDSKTTQSIIVSLGHSIAISIIGPDGVILESFDIWRQNMYKPTIYPRLQPTLATLDLPYTVELNLACYKVSQNGCEKLFEAIKLQCDSQDSSEMLLSLLQRLRKDGETSAGPRYRSSQAIEALDLSRNKNLDRNSESGDQISCVEALVLRSQTEHNSSKNQAECSTVTGLLGVPSVVDDFLNSDKDLTTAQKFPEHKKLKGMGGSHHQQENYVPGWTHSENFPKRNVRNKQQNSKKGSKKGLRIGHSDKNVVTYGQDAADSGSHYAKRSGLESPRYDKESHTSYGKTKLNSKSISKNVERSKQAAAVKNPVSKHQAMNINNMQKNGIRLMDRSPHEEADTIWEVPTSPAGRSAKNRKQYGKPVKRRKLELTGFSESDDEYKPNGHNKFKTSRSKASQLNNKNRGSDIVVDARISKINRIRPARAAAIHANEMIQDISINENADSQHSCSIRHPVKLLDPSQIEFPSINNDGNKAYALAEKGNNLKIEPKSIAPATCSATSDKKASREKDKENCPVDDYHIDFKNHRLERQKNNDGQKYIAQSEEHSIQCTAKEGMGLIMSNARNGPEHHATALEGFDQSEHFDAAVAFVEPKPDGSKIDISISDSALTNHLHPRSLESKIRETTPNHRQDLVASKIRKPREIIEASQTPKLNRSNSPKAKTLEDKPRKVSKKQVGNTSITSHSKSDFGSALSKALSAQGIPPKRLVQHPQIKESQGQKRKNETNKRTPVEQYMARSNEKLNDSIKRRYDLTADDQLSTRSANPGVDMNSRATDQFSHVANQNLQDKSAAHVHIIQDYDPDNDIESPDEADFVMAPHALEPLAFATNLAGMPYQPSKKDPDAIYEPLPKGPSENSSLQRKIKQNIKPTKKKLDGRLGDAADRTLRTVGFGSDLQHYFNPDRTLIDVEVSDKSENSIRYPAMSHAKTLPVPITPIQRTNKKVRISRCGSPVPLEVPSTSTHHDSNDSSALKGLYNSNEHVIKEADISPLNNSGSSPQLPIEGLSRSSQAPLPGRFHTNSAFSSVNRKNQPSSPNAPSRMLDEVRIHSEGSHGYEDSNKEDLARPLFPTKPFSRTRDDTLDSCGPSKKLRNAPTLVPEGLKFVDKAPISSRPPPQGNRSGRLIKVDDPDKAFVPPEFTFPQTTLHGDSESSTTSNTTENHNTSPATDAREPATEISEWRKSLREDQARTLTHLYEFSNELVARLNRKETIVGDIIVEYERSGMSLINKLKDECNENHSIFLASVNQAKASVEQTIHDARRTLADNSRTVDESSVKGMHAKVLRQHEAVSKVLQELDSLVV